VRAVGLKALKDRLSEYVRLAASGETILVTDRDHVVAEIGPPVQGRSDRADDAMLADAVRHGWLRPPTISAKGEPPPRKPVVRWSRLQRELSGDREDR
jgi:antitoxin (DNA-binding transcriptional repressor) of toxin-antitoxin stability system